MEDCIDYNEVITIRFQKKEYLAYKQILSKFIKAGGRIGITYGNELICISQDETIRGRVFGLEKSKYSS